MMTENSVTIVRPDSSDTERQGAAIVQRAKDLTITTKEDHAEAQTELVAIARISKAIEGEVTGPPKKSSHKAWKDIVAWENGLLAPFKEARGIYNGKMDTFEAEQKRIAEEAAAEAEEEARKLEEERRLEEAIEVEAAGGDPDEILEQPIEAPVIEVTPDVAKVDGVSGQTRYSCKVVDIVMLAKYVVDHPEWANLIEPNMPALNRIAVSQREAFKVPGCQIVKKTIRSVRTA